jgi:hypothetical protein
MIEKIHQKHCWQMGRAKQEESVRDFEVNLESREKEEHP